MEHDYHQEKTDPPPTPDCSDAQFGKSLSLPASYNKESFAAVERAKFNRDLIRPLHSHYCTADIMGLVLNVLGCTNSLAALPKTVLPKKHPEFTKVVLVLADGFGWNLYQRFRNKLSLLEELEEDGIVSKITAQYPSATPTQLTTLATGLPACRNRVFDRAYFEPLVDENIVPLSFCFQKDEEKPNRQERLLNCGVSFSELFSTGTIYGKLRDHGVTPYVYLRTERYSSPFTTFFYQDAERSHFSNAKEAIRTLTGKLSAEVPDEKSFHYLHWLPIDQAAHKYLPDSQKLEAVVREFFTELELGINKIRESNGSQGKVLLILTADHGQTVLDPNKEIRMSRFFPDLLPMMRTNKKSQVIHSTGSLRNRFFYIKQGFEEQAAGLLKEQIKGWGEIYLTRDLIDQNFFGAKPPSPDFLDRVGNVALLLRSGVSITWDGGKTWTALHGGLSREEMEVPFITEAI